VGRIAGRIAVAGGGDWGTDTIEILDQNRRWREIFLLNMSILVLKRHNVRV
jgi:hypothetical protein